MSDFKPGEFALPPTTPGGLATGVDGERLGATNVAADGTVGEDIDPRKSETIKLNIRQPKTEQRIGAIKYPSEPGIIDEDSDYVMFSFYEYQPPFGSSSGGVPADSNDTSKAATNPWGYSNYQDSSDRTYNNPAEGLKSIILYTPEDIQSQFGAGWNGAGFGAAASGMLSLAGSFNAGQRDWSGMLQAFTGSIPGVVKTAAFSGITEAINASTGASISLNQTLGTVTGTIINPNVELAYEAPKLRNFSLKFKLVPRTGKETKDIQKICNTFKKAMLPNFGGQALFGATKEAANLLTIPNLCQVLFMKGSNIHPYLPKYKLCGITDVNINYTAAGAYATMGDGSPVATELTISFLESKLIFAGEVKIDGGGI